MQDFEAMIAQRSKQPHRYPLYTGNDCRHLDHSPFTFPLVPYESGTLEAIGYIGGKEAAHFTRRTPGKPAALRLAAETLGRSLAADGTDAIFIRAEVVDKNGEIVPSAAPQVTFNVNGSAALISEPAVNAEAGIATALIHASDHPGAARIDAATPGLESAQCAIVSAGP
jgi:beta-galactosidase